MNFPIISALILLPTIGSLFLIFSKSNDQSNSTIKYVALFTSIVNFLLSIYLWFLFDETTSAFQFVEDREWLIGIVNYKGWCRWNINTICYTNYFYNPIMYNFSQ
jgi:NADH-quinone oxidoreductase subunit M